MLAAGGLARPKTAGQPDLVYSLDQTTICDKWDALYGGCPEGRVDCPTAPPDDEQNEWRLTDVTVTNQAGEVIDEYSECLNYAVLQKPVTPQLALEALEKKVPTTTFTLSPARTGIVELPEIVSVDQPAQLVMADTLVGQAVVLRATAQQYIWTFGDGANLTVDNPGTPYSSATPCPNDATCDAYVHHTYTGSGTYPIAVTVVWHGEFAVNGGAWQDIPQAITMASDPVQLPVAEVQTVNGGR